MDLSELAGPWADYDIERHNAPRAETMEGYRAASRAATAPRMVLGEAYGPGEREKLDLLAPAASGVPAIVFIHGGYWRAGAREDRRYPASFFVPRGVAWMSLGYPLTGTTRLPGIVDSVRRAAAYLKNNAARLGLDPARLVLVGNSAGAHLAAMALLTAEQAPTWRGAALISGVFDLVPYLDFEIAPASGITRENAESLSPLRQRRPLALPVALTLGAHEPPMFHRHTALFAAHLAALGAAVERIPGAGHDHFSIIGELGRDGPLTRALLKMAA
jgi:arylformamidase